MSDNKEKRDLNKKIPFILSLIFVCFILCSFLYSLVQLVIEPSKCFVIEER